MHITCTSSYVRRDWVGSGVLVNAELIAQEAFCIFYTFSNCLFLIKHMSLDLLLCFYNTFNLFVVRFHDILVPNVYIRIFPDGYVLYSIRYTAKSKSIKFQKKSGGANIIEF